MKPTVHDAPNFNVRIDADALHKAFKGLGTDEEAVVRVLGHRSNKQRVEIAQQFKNLFGKDLVEKLQSELKGSMEMICVAAVTPHYEYLARELHAAIDGVGTNEATLTEILATSNNNAIRGINSTYKRLYSTTLEKDIKKDTSGSFERLLVLLCQGNRDESSTVDVPAAKQDAVALFNAGEARMGTDETTFNTILALRSFSQLRQIFQEYKTLSGHDFEDAVEKEFSGGTEAGIVNIVRAANNPTLFFAKRLHEAMQGIGTKERQLIRLIVSRSELDLGDIKDEFQKKYNMSLRDALEKETSGDFKKMIHAIVG